jgi:glutaconate CoA-transferase subunit B
MNMQSKEYAKDYRFAELMAVVASREIRNGDSVFVGIGIPMIAAFLAIHFHAPETVLVFEGGYIGGHPLLACTETGDSMLGYGSPYFTTLWRTFSDTQRGYCDMAIIGAAQVDKYGNVNSTMILDNRSSKTPKTRLPGSGGANDMASSAKRVLIMARLDKRIFVPQVDYLTSPGYIDGPGARERAGLTGGGPVSVVSDKAIFKFDDETKEMYLSAVYPGVKVEQVVKDAGWKLNVPEHLDTVEPPTTEEVDFIRSYDPTDLILREKCLFETLDFPSWVSLTRESMQRRKRSNTYRG